MKSNFDSSFSLLMTSEGGYVNDANDAGGETNLGVTKAAWSSYLGRPIHDGEMKELTKDVVKPFYKKMYWDKVHGDDLPVGLDYAVFDFAVNAGTGRASKFLQQAVGVVDDGVIGSNTMIAVAKMNPKTIIEQFSAAKESFYKAIVDKNPSQVKFIKGWLARVDNVEATSKNMIA
jgi:lysozyme family protein